MYGGGETGDEYVAVTSTGIVLLTCDFVAISERLTHLLDVARHADVDGGHILVDEGVVGYLVVDVAAEVVEREPESKNAAKLFR